MVTSKPLNRNLLSLWGILLFLALPFALSAQQPKHKSGHQDPNGSAEQQNPDMSYLKGQSAKEAPRPAPFTTADCYFDNLEEAKKSPLDVIRLNLQYHHLKAIPSELCMFTNLKELDLSNNEIQNLEVGFSCPIALRKLYLNNNQITELPAQLAMLSQLQVLVAYDNPVAHIDPAIANLKNLKELWLSGNGNISSMQPAIWEMKNLEVLRLWNFGLEEIPDAIAGIRKLNTLCVQKNNIKSLNPEVCQLPSLNYLNLGHNQISSLPAEIKNCTRLGYLGIYENPIRSFPDGFSFLSKTLERISAWETNIPVETQNNITRSFPKTALMFTAIDIH
jgi:Leucine-rich repeat (LRR) protein